jgi:hypothetical protein
MQSTLIPHTSRQLLSLLLHAKHYYPLLTWSEAPASRQKHQIPTPNPTYLQMYSIQRRRLPTTLRHVQSAKDVRTEQCACGGEDLSGRLQLVRCPAVGTLLCSALKPFLHPTNLFNFTFSRFSNILLFALHYWH